MELTILRIDRLDLLKQASKARQGRRALAQVEFRKCDEKHRPVAPMGGDCGSSEHLAIEIFSPTSIIDFAVAAEM